MDATRAAKTLLFSNLPFSHFTLGGTLNGLRSLAGELPTGLQTSERLVEPSIAG